VGGSANPKRAASEKALSTRTQPSQKLIEFLKLPASYPHRPRRVLSMQTHISWVFIASPLVFKIKKPVNLGFLDFSTLKSRHHFCQRELELNRRLCPDVYLGVLPIYQTHSGFSFKTKEKIAEYCLKMKELPKGWFLGELLAKGRVGEREINRIISRLRRFYELQRPDREIEQWGLPEKLKVSTDENFTQIEPLVGKKISPAAFEVIRHFTNEFYVRNEKLFHRRIQQHRIRDCHGDLHLDHIHLTSKATTIFDCIEFNDRFRFIDVANDVAFLAMDFDFEGRSDLGNLFLRNCAREFHDTEMLKLSDFYKCYRALVRGKVESIQAASRKRAKAGEHAKAAARYFRLALRYTVSGSEPLLFAVIGRVGTGKSTVASALGNELNWPVFSSDQIRKTLAGVPVTKRTPARKRAEVYSRQMTAKIYNQLLARGLAAAKIRGGAIIDATFSSSANRELLRQQCEKAHLRFQAVELEVDLGEIKRRLRARDKGVSVTSDARFEDLEKLLAAYEAPSQLSRNLIRVPADNAVSATVKSVLLRLTELQLQPGSGRA
jgi:aminoglycoside phosphotransferase family enzyme/predicted kinase